MPRVVPSQVVAFIDQTFSFAASQLEGHRINLTMQDSSRLAGIVALVDRIPGELLVLDSSQYSTLVCCIEAVRTAITTWQARGDVNPLIRVPGLPDLSPVTLIRHALSSCPDEYPSASTAELTFIDDLGLRLELGKDIGATNVALSNNEWKAATVLAGSVIEALLLWALQQHSPSDVSNAIQELLANGKLNKKPKTDYEEWYLSEYIEVTEQLGVIKPKTAAQARLARDFRNLIHPGRAQRLGQTCDRATALSAVAAVEHVVRDLTP